MNQTVALRQLAARVITRNTVTALTASRLQQRFPTALQRAHFANASSSVLVSETRTSEKVHHDHGDDLKEKPEPIVKEACGDIDEVEDSDDEMETEEMFVDPHETFEHKTREWGGPRRGGRLLEPTRFGDWERKGRCSDF